MDFIFIVTFQRPALAGFFLRQEIEPGFVRMRTLVNVSSVFAVRRAHFFVCQETEPGFERMRTHEDVSSVSDAGRARFFAKFQK